jgi:hypothetical protein
MSVDRRLFLLVTLTYNASTGVVCAVGGVVYGVVGGVIGAIAALGGEFVLALVFGVLISVVTGVGPNVGVTSRRRAVIVGLSSVGVGFGVIAVAIFGSVVAGVIVGVVAGVIGVLGVIALRREARRCPWLRRSA